MLLRLYCTYWYFTTVEFDRYWYITALYSFDQCAHVVVDTFQICIDCECLHFLAVLVASMISFFSFSCIFILLSRESDQCAIRARLGVAGHLSTTPRWGNPAKCLSQRHNK